MCVRIGDNICGRSILDNALIKTKGNKGGKAHEIDLAKKNPMKG
jgi:hypothetical protein